MEKRRRRGVIEVCNIMAGAEEVTSEVLLTWHANQGPPVGLTTALRAPGAANHSPALWKRSRGRAMEGVGPHGPPPRFRPPWILPSYSR